MFSDGTICLRVGARMIVDAVTVVVDSLIH